MVKNQSLLRPNPDNPKRLTKKSSNKGRANKSNQREQCNFSSNHRYICPQLLDHQNRMLRWFITSVLMIIGTAVAILAVLISLIK